MKKLFVFLSFATAAALVTSSGALAQPGTGQAVLSEINGSGIRAEIVLFDSGSSTLAVAGRATGLDPTKTYISLLYDKGSPVDGPNACEPTIPPGSPGALTFPQMTTNVWTVFPDGTGILFRVKAPLPIPLGLPPTSYVRLPDVGTVSVREVVPVGPAVLKACGEVRIENLHPQG